MRGDDFDCGDVDTQLPVRGKEGAQQTVGNAGLGLERGQGLNKDLGVSHSEVNAEAVRMDEITAELTYGGRMEDKHRGTEGGREENQKPASPARARGKLCRARCRPTEESAMKLSLKRPQNQLAESSCLTV